MVTFSCILKFTHNIKNMMEQHLQEECEVFFVTKEEYEENVIGMKEESYAWDDREEEDR